MTDMNSGAAARRPFAELGRRGLFALGGACALAACTASAPADDRQLESALRGRVLLPGDAGFDQARTPWRLGVDQPARAVVEVADTDDVAALVRYARDAGRTLAVQPYGHGASGTTRDAILVRTNRIDEIRIDAENRTARIGAGVTSGPLQAAASAHGLTALAGSSPVVGVAGYVLGGGLSWFARAYGWAADSVTALEVIDAHGNPLRATASSETDLFWALRGGGGDYALVTAIELDLHPVAKLYGGQMLWPAHRGRQVIDAFREITATAPPELTLWWNLMNVPAGPAVVGIDITYLGDGEQARALLRPLDRIADRLSDSRRVLAIAELGTVSTEPTDPSPARSRTELLTHLDDSVAESLLAAPTVPLITQIRHLGGALAQPSSAVPGRMTEPYCLTFIAPQPTAQTAPAIQQRLDALGEIRSGRTPFTFLTPGRTAADALAPEILARLREIKRRRDPHKVFRSNYPVG